MYPEGVAAVLAAFPYAEFCRYPAGVSGLETGPDPVGWGFPPMHEPVVDEDAARFTTGASLMIAVVGGILTTPSSTSVRGTFVARAATEARTLASATTIT